MKLVAALATGLALLLALPAGATSADIVISSGREGGSYYFIAKRLETELVVDHNASVEVRTSRGSLNNLSLLQDAESPVNVAFAQADALQQYLESHSAFVEEFFVMGDLGRECAFFIAGRQGASSFAALKRADGEISVDDASSGAAVTWERITSLEPALAATEAVYVPTMEAILQLKVGAPYTKLRSAMIVQRPRRLTKPLELVANDPENLKLLEVTAADVPNATLPDGSRIYSFERVTVGGSRRTKTLDVQTLCTRGMMLGSRSKLSKDLRSRLSNAMLEYGERIIKQDE